MLIDLVEDSSHAGVAICRSLRSFVLADDWKLKTQQRRSKAAMSAGMKNGGCYVILHIGSDCSGIFDVLPPHSILCEKGGEVPGIRGSPTTSDDKLPLPSPAFRQFPYLYPLSFPLFLLFTFSFVDQKSHYIFFTLKPLIDR